jgi:hypothetical protein
MANDRMPGMATSTLLLGRYSVEARGDVIILRLAGNRAVEVRIPAKQLERWIARKMREGMFA